MGAGNDFALSEGYRSCRLSDGNKLHSTLKVEMKTMKHYALPTKPSDAIKHVRAVLVFIDASDLSVR